MLKSKKVLWIFGAFILAFTILNPTVLAKGKEGLAHIVEEHSQRIAQLEEALKKKEESTPGTDSPVEALPADVKQAILKEANAVISDMYNMNVDDGRAVTVINTELVEGNGEVIIKVYAEGSYDWTAERGIGRSFASGFIWNFDYYAKMYGVNLKYEFYENDERIRIFTDLN